MAVISPDSLARNAIRTRMSDVATGFNPNYQSALSNYPTAPQMAIDFTSSSKNLFMGQFTVDQIQGAGTFTFPIARMWAKASANRNLQKFQLFAGSVRCYLAIDLSSQIFKSARVVVDSETWGDAVTAAVLATFNNATVQGNFMQNVVYNGSLGWERSPMAEDGTNWLQTILFVTELEVIIP